MREQQRKSEALLDAALESAKERTEDGLSEFRAHAVFAQVKAELKGAAKHRARWPLFAGLGTALAVAVAGWVLFYDRSRPIELAPQFADVVFRSSGVKVERGDIIVGEDATAIEGGTDLVLAEEARVDLDLRGEAKIAVFGPAEVAHAKDGAIRVKKGRASFSVAPHSKESPFVVQVGDDRVIVHGTKFDVHAGGGRLSRVDVSEGRVEVVRKGEPTRMLSRGESFSADESVVVASPAASFDAPWWPKVEMVKGYVFVETEPAGAEVTIDGIVIGRSPLLVRWPSGTREVSLSLSDRIPFTGSIDVIAGRVARISERLKAPGVISPPTPEPRPKTDHWKTARRLLKAGQCDRLDRVVKQIAKSHDHQDAARAEMLGAECQLRKGKKEVALARYRSIEKRHGDTSSAEAALFEAGNLEADLQQKSALGTLDRYLSRHPDGRFAEATKIRRCELLVSLDRLPEAHACLAGYRRDHPSGVRASQAVLLLATIARMEGRWSEAATAYREYLSGSPSAERAEKVEHHLIECLLRGELEGADRAIADYLSHHPNGPHAEEVKKWQRARASSR